MLTSPLTNNGNGQIAKKYESYSSSRSACPNLSIPSPTFHRLSYSANIVNMNTTVAFATRQEKEQAITEPISLRESLVLLAGEEAVEFVETTVLTNPGDGCFFAGSSGLEAAIAFKSGAPSGDLTPKSDLDIVTLTPNQRSRIGQTREGTYGYAQMNIPRANGQESRLEFVDGALVAEDARYLLLEVIQRYKVLYAGKAPTVESEDLKYRLYVLLEMYNHHSTEMANMLPSPESIPPEKRQQYWQDVLLNRCTYLGPTGTAAVFATRLQDGSLQYEIYDPQFTLESILLSAQQERNVYSAMGLSKAIRWTGNEPYAIERMLVDLVLEGGLWEGISKSAINAYRLILKMGIHSAQNRMAIAADPIGDLLLNQTSVSLSSQGTDVLCEYYQYIQIIRNKLPAIESLSVSKHLDHKGFTDTESYLKNFSQSEFTELCAINPKLAIANFFLYLGMGSDISPLVTNAIAGFADVQNNPTTVNNSLHEYVINGDITIVKFAFESMGVNLSDQCWGFISKFAQLCDRYYPEGLEVNQYLTAKAGSEIINSRVRNIPDDMSDVFALLYSAMGLSPENPQHMQLMVADIANWTLSGETKDTTKPVEKKLKRDVQIDAVLSKMLTIR